MFAAGVDGCRAEWIALKVDLASLITCVEVIDLAALLRKRPPELAFLGIDIPIGAPYGNVARTTFLWYARTVRWQSATVFGRPMFLEGTHGQHR
jgi:predicted RNase H-like nuclease